MIHFHLHLSAEQLYILMAAVGVLGLVLGSALNCLAMRMAAGQKWTGNERSACPHCGHVLSPADLVPVLSWVFLRGKCRYCGAKVSVRYPLTELGLALALVALLWVYGPSLHFLSLAVLVCCLFTLSLVDADTLIIPNRFLVIPFVLRLAELIVTEWAVQPVLLALLPGVILGGVVLLLSLVMDKVLKKDSMGGGDIKLLAVLGCFLPLPQCLLMVMLACVLGIAIASLVLRVDRKTAFPFAPSISLSACITLLVGEPLVNWYLGLFL